MIRFYISFLICLIAFISSNGQSRNQASTNFEYKLDTLTLVDSARNRNIPIAIWQPEHYKGEVVIFSHGYGFNKGDDYLAYSYLTDFLASKGYLVISIQHELKTDSLLPFTGNPQVVRRPFWNQGVENIQFVIEHVKSNFSEKELLEFYLIGHSNGGDITALFPQLHPNVINKVITLDNVRMPLPKMKNIEILTLRSNDQPADIGVLPNDAEQKEFNIKIIELKETGHNEMDDSGTESQKNRNTEFSSCVFRRIVNLKSQSQ